MKKLIVALLAISIALLAAIVYERIFVQSEFGPSTLLAVVLLSFFALALTATLLSIGSRFQELVTRAWLITISIGLTFVVVDIVAGAILVKRLSPALAPDPIRHHKLVANTHTRFEQPDFSYIQRVNNLGLRGDDRDARKAPNHYRILFLGDSFTMGKGVEDHQTFSVLLETSLNQQRACGNARIEVLNAGVDSYAPILSYLQLSGDLSHLDPDVILLNLDISDLIQEASYRAAAVYNSNGDVTAVSGSERPVLLNQRIRGWIDQYTFFTRLLLFHANKAMGYRDLSVQGVVTRANMEIARYTLADDRNNRDQQWAHIFESISKIKQFADKKSIPFALVIYPWGHQVSSREWIPGRNSFMPEDAKASDSYHETIIRRSRQLGIKLINVFPEFRAYRGETPLYFKYDMHWTTKGHEVMAAALEKVFLATHLMNRCNSNPAKLSMNLP